MVDSQAVADALNSGKLAGAGIDVFEQEPPLDTAHPLLHARNTIVTPHVAFASTESMVARAKIVLTTSTPSFPGSRGTLFYRWEHSSHTPRGEGAPPRAPGVYAGLAAQRPPICGRSAPRPGLLSYEKKVGKDSPGTSWFLDLRRRGPRPL